MIKINTSTPQKRVNNCSPYRKTCQLLTRFEKNMHEKASNWHFFARGMLLLTRFKSQRHNKTLEMTFPKMLFKSHVNKFTTMQNFIAVDISQRNIAHTHLALAKTGTIIRRYKTS